MKRLLMPALALVALGCSISAFAQDDEARAKASTRALQKLVKVELLNQILPVLLEPGQVRQLLRPIERCRARVKDNQIQEHKDLLRLEALFDEEIDRGVKKRAVPKKDVVMEIAKLLDAVELRRRLIVQENVDDVTKVFLEVANSGQRRTAANSLNARLFNFGKKPEELTESDKVRMFVSEVLLHPQAYDLLVGLSKGENQ